MTSQASVSIDTCQVSFFFKSISAFVNVSTTLLGLCREHPAHATLHSRVGNHVSWFHVEGMTASLENPSLRKLPLDSDDLVTVSVKAYTNSTNSSLEALKTSLQLEARKLDFFQEELKQTLSAASEACWKHIGLAPCDLDWSDAPNEVKAVPTESSIIKDESTPESEHNHSPDFLTVEHPIEETVTEEDSHEDVNSWRQFVQSKEVRRHKFIYFKCADQHETATQLSAERKCLENALDASLLQHAQQRVASMRISQALHRYKKHVLEPR